MNNYRNGENKKGKTGTEKNESIVRIYTVNHKKRGSLFLTITLANLNQFL